MTGLLCNENAALIVTAGVHSSICVAFIPFPFVLCTYVGPWGQCTAARNGAHILLSHTHSKTCDLALQSQNGNSAD